MDIHHTAQIAEGARLDGVSVGAFSIVHANVEIAPGGRIGAYCEIGHPAPGGRADVLRIGAGAHIRSHSVFYEGSVIGEGLVTGHAVVVRENTVAGRNAQIGSNADIQGDCAIGDYFRSQSSIFIPKGSSLGSYVWLAPHVALTNDPHPPSDLTLGCRIGDYAVLAARSVILPGVTVGEHALVAAGSVVTRDVPPHVVVAGTPAKAVGDVRDISLRDGSGRPAYPWPSHFRRGYPPEAFGDWAEISFPQQIST